MKDSDDYRNFDHAADGVRDFYRLNHRYQTLAFAQEKREQYAALNHHRMGIWEACEYLDTLVDDSDPDTSLTQIEHCLQTAEGIRADGHPDWFILAGLIHDLGKILCSFNEPQWAVTGDTFPLGCKFQPSIVYPEFLDDNPDSKIPAYQDELGIYPRHCGLDEVTLSWGHDEYMYLVARDYLPDPALYMIRYHSFYPGHSGDGYAYLFNEHDNDMFNWVRLFNRYDLYTKHDRSPDVTALKPFYQDLILRYFPRAIAW